MSRPNNVSAGLLAFRRTPDLEVLLGHPGGPFWAGKDAGAWTIPKGQVEPGADILATAVREFTEETNLLPAGDFMVLQDFLALQPVKQKGGKLVHAFAFEADLDLGGFASNTFAMEWPPRSGRRADFPEIDRIAYYPLAVAMDKILLAQRAFLDELQQRLGR